MVTLSLVITGCGGKSATCKVTVSKRIVDVGSVELNKTNASLKVGETVTLTATVKPEDATDKTVTWSTSDASVATIDDGVVTAVKLGSATITAQAGDKSATCSITVEATPVTSVTLDQTNASLRVGETVTLTATVKPDDATDKTMTWTTSDASVATIDNGVVTAIKLGSATITAKAGEKTATCSITVVATPVTSVTLDQTSASLQVGETVTLTATVKPDDATDKTVTWTTSDASVATVSNGVVTAKKVGSATITAKAGDKTATCSVIVDQLITGLRLDITSLSLNEGTTTTLTATVTPDYAPNQTLAWTSSDTSVATVDQNGKVTAVSKGTATITVATQDGSNLSASCTVKVIRPVASIVFRSYPNILHTGDTSTIRTEVQPSTADNTGISWSSSDPSVATVSDAGVVTALSPGMVTITATAQDGNGASNSCDVEVRQYVTDITLSESSLSLTEGGVRQVTASVTPVNAYDRTLNWTSSNESVAKVNSKGIVVAISQGAATITVYANDGSGLIARCAVSIKPQPQPEMVDLGLSVRWASFNMGASAPEEGGGLYAWGETDTKMNYTWATYKFNKGGDSDNSVQLSKYNSNSNWGTTDYKMTLDPQDDVARVKLGTAWRMPTREEFLELASSSNCTWEPMTLNGVEGSKVTSKKQGYTNKWIFLPAASRMRGENMEGRGCGFYLSSTRDSDSKCAYSLFIADNWIYGNTLSRYEGLSVRPVSDAVNPVTSVTLNKTSLTLETGQSETLTVSYTPTNATVKSVNWSSSNTAVATVSSTGVVKAVAPGNATITATASDGHGASDRCSVTVTAPTPKAVDLGLSVKWASFNVGATAPEEYGNYYAWGETAKKSSYSWDNYVFRTSGSSYSDLKFSKYNSISGYGAVDNKTVLDTKDDVAHEEWGGNWRMPTQAEFNELASNCTWEYTSINGVYGMKLTSKKQGYTSKWIFLPAAGRRDGSNTVNAGSRGYYWTSSHGVSWSDKAEEQFFNSSEQYITVLERYFGLTVRPVQK